MKKSNLAKLVVYLFIICTLFPVLFILCYSICKNWMYPSILPAEFTLEYYYFVLKEELFTSIFTSILLGTLTGFISIVISLPVARLLAYYNFKFKSLISLLVLLPLIVPSFTIVSLTHFNLIKYNLDGTIIGVALIHSVFAIPYVTKILYDHFIIIGKNQEINSKVLGASNIQTLVYVIIPQLKSAIFIAFMLAFTISLSQYITTLIIGGGKVVTLSTLLVPYVQSGNYQLASIYSIVIIVISLLCFTVITLSQKVIDRKFGGYYVKS